MLTMNIGVITQEFWNPETEKFRVEKSEGRIVKMEHSLYSMAKWEEKYRQPWMSNDKLEGQAFEDYLNYMLIEGDPISLSELDDENISLINVYIAENWTATKIKKEPASGPSPIITTEQIYASMCVANIKWEAQYWNFSRLYTLIECINDLKSEKKKMTPEEVLIAQREENLRRRRKYNSKG